MKWFNDSKCFGFITSEDGSEAFVHYTSIQGSGFKSLVEGDSVGFDTEKGPKGPKAINVVKTLIKREKAPSLGGGLFIREEHEQQHEQQKECGKDGKAAAKT